MSLNCCPVQNISICWAFGCFAAWESTQLLLEQEMPHSRIWSVCGQIPRKAAGSKSREMSTAAIVSTRRQLGRSPFPTCTYNCHEEGRGCSLVLCASGMVVMDWRQHGLLGEWSAFLSVGYLVFQTTLQTDEVKNVPCGTRYVFSLYFFWWWVDVFSCIVCINCS